MKAQRTILALLLASCAGSGPPPPPAASGAGDPVTIPETPQEPPRLRPAPGADLAGPVAPPVREARTKANDAVLDLGADRPLVKVSLPTPPRGGAAAFTFADGRKGWIARIPDAAALPAPAYGDGRIFVSGGLESTSVYALDAESGRLTWAAQELNDAGPTAPLFEDHEVLFNTYSCTLFVLDAKSGRELWKKWIGSEVMAQVATHDGLVFAGHPGASGGSELSAYRLKSGALVWTRAVDGELLAAPVVEGGSVYVSTIGGNTYRFEEKKGKRVWAKRLHATTVPWVAGDNLYVSRREKGQEVQAVVSVATGEVIATHHAGPGKYLWDMPTTAAAAWGFEGASRPVIAAGVQYDAMGGLIRASDPATGDLLWTRRYAAGEGKRSVGAVAVAGPQVVVATRKGDVYGLDVDTGYTLWAFAVGKGIAAQPIVANGWVYATTTDGAVVALNVGDSSLDGWHMWGGNSEHNGLEAPAQPN